MNALNCNLIKWWTNIWSRAQIFLRRGERCRQWELATDSGPRERLIGQPLRERSPRGWSLPGGRDIAHSMAILSQASGRWSPCFRHFRYVFVSIVSPLPPFNTAVAFDVHSSFPLSFFCRHTSHNNKMPLLRSVCDCQAARNKIIRCKKLYLKFKNFLDRKSLSLSLLLIKKWSRS